MAALWLGLSGRSGSRAYVIHHFIIYWMEPDTERWHGEFEIIPNRHNPMYNKHNKDYEG